ncbi:MAG: hypothetical protein LBR08_13725 [Bacteroidales bacterium]|jgi:hypothetical protein|nr:hypothetical protein [Bacteroidales bacterium]
MLAVPGRDEEFYAVQGISTGTANADCAARGLDCALQYPTSASRAGREMKQTDEAVAPEIIRGKREKSQKKKGLLRDKK